MFCGFCMPLLGLISKPRESLGWVVGALAALAMIVFGGLSAGAKATEFDGFVSGTLRTAGSGTNTGAAATFVGDNGVAATCCCESSRFKRSISNRASDEKFPFGY